MKNIIVKHSFIALLVLVSSSLYASAIKGVTFSSLPGDKTEMKLTFDGVPPEASGYTIEEPARIALDLPGTTSDLKTKYHKIGLGNARTAIIVGTQEKTRVIINLTELTGYQTRTEGNNLFVVIGQQEVFEVESTSLLAAQNEPKYQAKKKDESGRIVDVDFRRGDLGEGQVLISLSNPNVPVDISQESGRIRVEFGNVSIAEEMRRRLDVRDFATPVRFIDATLEAGKPVFFIEPSNDRYEYLAYQTDNLLTVNVKPLTKAEQDRQKE